MMQVLWNLIRNAAKFTPQTGRLTIRTTNPPEPAGSADGQSHRLVVDFEDTGIGIDPEVLPRIFDAFEQGHDDLRGRSGGLGLGLAISRSLTEALGRPAHSLEPRSRTGLDLSPGADGGSRRGDSGCRPSQVLTCLPLHCWTRPGPTCASCWSKTTRILAGSSRAFSASAATMS